MFVRFLTVKSKSMCQGKAVKSLYSSVCERMVSTETERSGKSAKCHGSLLSFMGFFNFALDLYQMLCLFVDIKTFTI